jgi:hypothetical protein
MGVLILELRATSRIGGSERARHIGIARNDDCSAWRSPVLVLLSEKVLNKVSIDGWANIDFGIYTPF